MKNKKLITQSLLSAVGVVVYILFVATLLNNAQAIFGHEGEKDNLLAPLFMLMLFVISASVTGFLVLGKPIELFISGSRKEATNLFLFTLLWMGIILFLVALLLMK